ncbi:hypothetical protein C1646_724440, partial [Rhizophagus diaphanus]
MAIPKDEDELRYAIWSVLKSVMILHANEIVHRDIRWENVMRLTDNSWVLIDFEEAAPIGRGNRRTPILNIAAPEYRGMESDPNLLNDLRILQIQLSASARKFRDRL